MSQDLFAAFGDVPQANTDQQAAAKPSQANNHSFFDGFDTGGQAVVTGGAPPQAATDDFGEDDWGDFEGAESAQQAGQQAKPVPVQQTIFQQAPRYQYSLDDLGSSLQAPPTKQLPQHEVDLLGFTEAPFTNVKSTTQPAPHNHSTKTKESNVLFDANEDESEDDDFGDFADFDDYAEPRNETSNRTQVKREPPKPTPQAAKTVARPAEFDLLGLDDPVEVKPKTKSSGFGKNAALKSPKKPKQVVSKPVVQATQEDEPWDDFSTWGNKDVSKAAATSSSAPGDVISAAPDLRVFGTPVGPTEDALPPTNVPPPALLLSLFPPIFEQVERELLKPTASQTQEVKQKVYSDPKTIQYLEGYLSIVGVCARIIAGRKLRWKRDTILAQSMRIGAASGRSTGMKITSVDKQEVAREDQEVAELLRVWGLQVGKLKSALAEVKKTKDIGTVPELRQALHATFVKTVKEMEGGVTSARPCALCGLKRDERIDRVDVDVLDSFGEFWIDRTSMHKSCRNFWAEHETTLRQR